MPSPSKPLSETPPSSAAWRVPTSAASRAIGHVAAVFAVAVGVTLAVSEAQALRRPPLDLAWAAKLTAAARANGGDPEAARALRDLDAIARHAHFSHAAFRERGLVLLLAGCALSLACFAFARWLVAPPPDPRLFGGAAQPERARARRFATVLFVLAVAFGLGSAAILLVPRRDPDIAAETRPAPSEGRTETAPGTGPRSTGEPVATAAPAQRSTVAWPSFRGPRGIGVATNALPDLAVLQSAAPRWEATVARLGFSSPVVAGGLVFVTSGDAEVCEVLAFDLETGAQRCATPVPFGEPPGTALPEVTSDTGYAAPSPAADDASVYAIFATGDLVALRHDGALRWKHSLGVPDKPYGHSSSLLAHAGVVYVQLDEREAGRLLAVRGEDGTILWDVERDVHASWASPILLDAESGPLLVLAAPDSLAAHRGTDGGLTWNVEGVMGEVAPSPGFDAGRLFLAQEYGRMVAYDLSATPPAVLWEQFDELPSIASPVAGHGMVWIATSTGVVSAHDAVTGELRWRHEFDEGFNASPLLAGNHLLLLDLGGTLHVLGTGPAYEPLATRAFGEAAYATPAVLPDRLIVRTQSKLVAVP